MYRIRLDNAEGYAPNNVSNGLAAAHNSDGFGVASSKQVRIRDSVVVNQDDCVAVTSGDGVVVDNMWCNGSHGLSIGSVGGKSSKYFFSLSPFFLPFFMCRRGIVELDSREHVTNQA